MRDCCIVGFVRLAHYMPLSRPCRVCVCVCGWVHDANMVPIVTVDVPGSNGTRTSTEIMMSTKPGMIYLDNEPSVSDLAQLIALCWRDNKDYHNIIPSKLQRELSLILIV